MIIGIGTDIVDVARIKKLFSSHSRQKLLRIFTQEELDYSFQSKNVWERLAVRFCVKEATYKALRSGVLRLNEIEVTHDTSGKPNVQLHGVTHEFWCNLGMPDIFISFAHTREYASAVIVLEKI
ncbi:holo-[acyl-carrier protein] synthase [Brevinema andersonii]|uniref:Holo-[acyl-carrier-protein] synthase n=1 Tax=Brevinema andersonii TaxID=34097 RepID=A0A1I1E4D4_BREAD|nr:holo-ACP synthase [Brevinema andersonii]SFB79723.1 holo-[acyl-carrier protein] synthase [Brevinema andersonii]